MKKKLIVLTGAGMSAESGIKTFRDHNGLWENHDVMDVASPEGFAKNPELVLRFYNERRAQLKEVEPNIAHKMLVQLEQNYEVSIITQNVDDLHERAGSSHIIHLHGELTKCRSVHDESLITPYDHPIKVGDTATDGHQLRPHIVWFGEAVPKIEEAANLMPTAEIVMVIGTSMQVYPAAGLISYANRYTPIYYIDPKPAISTELSMFSNLSVIEEKATIGVARVMKDLLAD